MLRVYRTEEGGDARLDALEFDRADSDLAWAAYFKTSRMRTGVRGWVHVESDGAEIARYSTQQYWQGPRETIRETWAKIWAPPPHFTGPSPEQIAGLWRASGLKQRELAEMVGRNLREIQRWVAGDTKPRFCTWTYILLRTEFLGSNELVQSPRLDGGKLV